MKQLPLLLCILLLLLGRGMCDTSSEREVDALRLMAEAEAAGEFVEDMAEDVSFKAKGLSLQALNPEISVTGDMVACYREQDGVTERAKFDFRCVGLHFESYLDPYSRFKAAIPVNENGAELGEAYFTRFGAAKGLSFTLGKFRQQFGVVNRWHKHGLDQVDFPLPLRMIFGDGGLNQTGVSLDWTMPEFGNALQELTFQITEGKNERLFGGNTKSTPSVLGHYKNYRDISKDTYVEFGLTGLIGWNDEWNLSGDVVEHESRPASVFGADMTLLWEPTERMRYCNFVWRSEAYLLNKEVLAFDGSGEDTLNAWGVYTYLQSKVSRTWDVGVRADYYRPDSKRYADAGSLSPLAVTEDGAYRWQIGPYVTWHQSPWVRFRLEYNHQDGCNMDEADDCLMFQCIFAAGPHKHERY